MTSSRLIQTVFHCPKFSAYMIEFVLVSFDSKTQTSLYSIMCLFFEIFRNDIPRLVYTLALLYVSTCILANK